MDKVAAQIPEEKPKRKRRKAEEMLVEEARAQVFGGADPGQPESEALALVMHAEAITAAVEQQQQLPPHQISTSSRSTAQHSLAAQMQKKEEDKAMALTLWKKKWATAPPVADPPAKKRGGRGQPHPFVHSSVKQLTTTNSSKSSLALVPLNMKQSGPKASPSSISIAKPAAALVRATPLTNAAKTNQPNINNDYDQNNDDDGNNSSARHRPSMIPVDSQWKEYPKVCEDVVDEVLTKMNQRNANEVAKAQQMRAGILDVLYIGVTIKKSAEARLVARTTMRRYCYEVKQQLEDFLGMGNEQLLRQFGHQQQKKKELSLKALRTEIMKAGGDDKAAQKRAEPVNGEEDETTPKGKRPTGNRKRKAPNEAEDMEEADQQQHIVETPPPKQNKQQNNLLKEANNSSVSATTSTSKRARRTPAATAKRSTDSAVAKEKAPAADDQTLQLIMVPGKPMKALISTRTGGERQRFRGTKRQLRDIVTELARSKYQGDPDHFSEVITDLIIMDRSVKKAMARHGFPLELVQMGCRLVNRFYDIEQILDDE